MANPNRNNQPEIEKSEQELLNMSFDREFNVLAVEQLANNGTALTRQPTPFLTKPYDRLIITYTDSTKTVISTIVTKLSGTTQETLTNTSTATVDDFQRS